MASPSLRYPTIKQVVKINERVTKQAGLLRDKAALDSALNRPKMAAYYQQADIAEQMALLVDGIAMNHPFIDGNKRTALVTGIAFLRANGGTIVAKKDETAKEIERLVVSRDVERFIIWIRAHLTVQS